MNKRNVILGIVALVTTILMVVIILLVSCGGDDDNDTKIKETTKTNKTTAVKDITTKEAKTTEKESGKSEDTTQNQTGNEEETQNQTTQSQSEQNQTTKNENSQPNEEQTTKGQSSSNNTAGLSRLHVEGTKIYDESGNVVVLNGISTHGIAWFPQYVNKDAFSTIKNSFGANVIRIAMYTDPGAGYSTAMHTKVDEAVQYASEVGLYVIIDWHILSDNNPNMHKTEAIAFFDEMSRKYKDYSNVLYEICNEPNGGTTWNGDIKPYAEEVIATIRRNDPKGIILVGTPTWSQDVDQAADNPITGYDNIMYTLHFYAATHKEWIQQKLTYAIGKGIPIFISEFSICDASGNGANDIASANTWMNILDQYNISFVGWNLSNKSESSAIIRSDCNKTSGWTDGELTESGLWLVNQLRSH